MKKIIEHIKSEWYKYAIEILVLIIGIYGAFELDNWNENRRERESLHAIYRIIKTDLSTNHIEMEKFIRYYEEKRKPAFDSILFGNLSEEQMRADPRFRWVYGGYQDLAVNTRGYELLKKLGNNLLLENSLASDIAYFYNDRLKEIDVAQKELGDDFQDNFQDFKEYNWITNHLVYNDSKAYYQFLLNNPEAKNRVFRYQVLYEIYVSELKEFISQSQKLIEQIDSELERK